MYAYVSVLQKFREDMDLNEKTRMFVFNRFRLAKFYSSQILKCKGNESLSQTQIF